MKKNINDYKGTKTAIEVNSVEEFDSIKKLLEHKQRREYCFKENNSFISCYSDDYSIKQYQLDEGFTIYSAKDITEEQRLNLIDKHPFSEEYCQFSLMPLFLIYDKKQLTGKYTKFKNGTEDSELSFKSLIKTHKLDITKNYLI